ncbi:MAG: hypothetical protein HKM07_05085 [Chlamydiae bacterium]|nr:hypothetical protein [Chlamydiota bacterium]
MSGISHLCRDIAQASLHTLSFGVEESSNSTFVNEDKDSETAEIPSLWLDAGKSLNPAFFGDKDNIETLTKCYQFLVNPQTIERLNKRYRELIHIDATIDHINLTLYTMGYRKIPRIFGVLAIFTPVFVHLGKQARVESLTGRSVVSFLDKHTIDLCQGTAIATSVALLFFGKTAFASTSLLFLSVAVLYRNQLLPDMISEKVRDYEYLAKIVTVLVLGDNGLRRSILPAVFLMGGRHMYNRTFPAASS